MHQNTIVLVILGVHDLSKNLCVFWHVRVLSLAIFLPSLSPPNPPCLSRVYHCTSSERTDFRCLILQGRCCTIILSSSFVKIWSARLIVLQIGQGGGWSEGTGIVGVKKATGER